MSLRQVKLSDLTCHDFAHNYSLNTESQRPEKVLKRWNSYLVHQPTESEITTVCSLCHQQICEKDESVILLHVCRCIEHENKELHPGHYAFVNDEGFVCLTPIPRNVGNIAPIFRRIMNREISAEPLTENRSYWQYRVPKIIRDTRPSRNTARRGRAFHPHR